MAEPLLFLALTFIAFAVVQKPIIEWGYGGAPARVPIFSGDFPKVDDPLSRFLDDRQPIASRVAERQPSAASMRPASMAATNAAWSRSF